MNFVEQKFQHVLTTILVYSSSIMFRILLTRLLKVATSTSLVVLKLKKAAILAIQDRGTLWKSGEHVDQKCFVAFWDMSQLTYFKDRFQA